MKHQDNLRERYIQLVETFITALENRKSGLELDEIRKEIRSISSQLGINLSVENPTQVAPQMRSDQQDKTNVE